ncbi:MAG: hypothetical protein ABJE00_16330, partial [Erythrobacter sp.]
NQSAHLQDIANTLGKEAFDSLLTQFYAEMNQTLVDLEKETSLENVAILSHKASGSAAVFSANALREALISVENAAKSKNWEQTTHAINKLPATWDETKILLRKIK